jgi:hypothetical protein
MLCGISGFCRRAASAASQAWCATVRAFEAWQAMANRKAGPLFRKISTGDRIGADLLDPDAIRRIQERRVGMAGLGHRWL